MGTSYDGRKYLSFRGKKPGEGIRITVGEEKMWEITKQYDSDAFADDESCLGYQVEYIRNQSIKFSQSVW